MGKIDTKRVGLTTYVLDWHKTCRVEINGVKLTQNGMNNKKVQDWHKKVGVTLKVQDWHKTYRINIKGVTFWILKKGARFTKRCKIDKKGRIDTKWVKLTQT